MSAAWPGEAGGSVPLPRSYLYVPGNARDKLGRALDRGADALIVDLEDAVPTAAKEAARTEVVRWLAATDPGACQLWVRVNSGALRNADVAALAGAAHLTGLVLAKLDDPAEVDDVAGALAATGDETTLLMPLLESARAVLAAPTIAARRRVRQLQIGEVDLCADTEIEPGDDDAELAPLRAQVVLASAAAGIASPVGPVSTNVTDLPAFKASTRRVRRQGFVGRCCIHPAQLDVVHRVFTPTEQETTTAAELVAAFDAAGSGVLLDAAGRMVDLAVIRRARQLLAMAGSPHATAAGVAVGRALPDILGSG